MTTEVPAHPDDADLPNVTAEVESQASDRERIEAAREKAQKAITELPGDTGVSIEEAALPPPVTEPVEGRKVFVSPEFLKGKFMVKPGPTTKERLADGREIPVRDDDLFARFNGGILATDDPDIIFWASTHPEICRDLDDPTTPVWVAMTTAKLSTSRKEPSLPPELDIEKLLKGDAQQLLGGAEGALLEAARAARGT